MKKEFFLVLLVIFSLVSMAGAQTPPPPPPIGICPPLDPNLQCPVPPPEAPLMYCFNSAYEIIGSYNDPCVACNLNGCYGIADALAYNQWLANNQAAPAPVVQDTSSTTQQQPVPEVQVSSTACPISIPTSCPSISDPVCGSDGITTYLNPCVACAEGVSSFTPGACSNSQTIASAANTFLQEDPSLKSLGSTNIVIEPSTVLGESTADIAATTTEEETETGSRQTTTIEIRGREAAQLSAEIRVTQAENGDINKVVINLDEATIKAE